MAEMEGFGKTMFWKITQILISAATVIISTVALIISYKVAFSPADIRVTAGAPLWILRSVPETTLATGKAEVMPMLMMKVTCAFSNVGARNGLIEYVAVRFQSEDGTKWLFAPYTVVDDAKLMTDGWDKGTWQKGSFYPVVVPGKQSEVVSYLFFSESGLKTFDSVTLAPHKFKVTILTWATNDNQWREQQQFTMNFDQDLIGKLSKGVIFGMPSVEQQQRVQSIR